MSDPSLSAPIDTVLDPDITMTDTVPQPHTELITEPPTIPPINSINPIKTEQDSHGTLPKQEEDMEGDVTMNDVQQPLETSSDALSTVLPPPIPPPPPKPAIHEPSQSASHVTPEEEVQPTDTTSETHEQNGPSPTEQPEMQAENGPSQAENSQTIPESTQEEPTQESANQNPSQEAQVATETVPKTKATTNTEQETSGESAQQAPPSDPSRFGDGYEEQWNRPKYPTPSHKILTLHQKKMSELETRDIEEYLADCPSDVIIEVLAKFGMDNDAIFNHIDNYAFGDPSKRRVFVRGLSYDVNEDALRAAFEKIGTVDDATIIYDRMQNKSKGYGFITFGNAVQADNAVRRGWIDVEGRQAQISLATPLRNPDRIRSMQPPSGADVLSDDSGRDDISDHGPSGGSSWYDSVSSTKRYDRPRRRGMGRRGRGRRGGRPMRDRYDPYGPPPPRRGYGRMPPYPRGRDMGMGYRRDHMGMGDGGRGPYYGYSQPPPYQPSRSTGMGAASTGGPAPPIPQQPPVPMGGTPQRGYAKPSNAYPASTGYPSSTNVPSYYPTAPTGVTSGSYPYSMYSGTGVGGSTAAQPSGTPYNPYGYPSTASYGTGTAATYGTQANASYPSGAATGTSNAQPGAQQPYNPYHYY